MTNALEARWTPEEEAWLRDRWGKWPRRQIARALGRSEMAVQVRVRRLKIPAPTRWEHIMTGTRLARALGLADPMVAIRLMRDGKLPAHTVYLGNRPILAVNIKRLQRWLRNPANWYCLDVDKIEDPRFRRPVEQARRQWDDRWLTPAEACDLLGYTLQGLNKLIHSGRLPARRHGNWWIRRSHALAMRRQEMLS